MQYQVPMCNQLPGDYIHIPIALAAGLANVCHMMDHIHVGAAHVDIKSMEMFKVV